MIELDSLKFTVDTTDLKTAITAVGDLQAAVSKQIGRASCRERV